MDAHKAMRCQLGFDIYHRSPRQPVTELAVKLNAVPGRAHPVDLAGAQHHNPIAAAHLDQRRLVGFRWGRGTAPRWRLNAGGGILLPGQSPLRDPWSESGC